MLFSCGLLPGRYVVNFSAATRPELGKAASCPDKVLAGTGLQENVHGPVRKPFRNAKVFEAVTIEPR